MSIELKCTCGRALKLPRRALVARLKENKPPRCSTCGAALGVPEELAAEARAAAEAGTVFGRCPACANGAPASAPLPGEGYCKRCQLPFWCASPGEGRFDRPAREVATDAELTAARSRLERVPGGALIDWVLQRRRAQGTLEQGEAARLVESLWRIAGWTRARPTPSLPLPVVEVLHLLGPIVIQSQTVQVDESRGEVRTVSAMTLGGGPQQSHVSAYFGRFGFRQLLTRGAEVSAGDPVQPSELHVHEVLYRLRQHEEGTAIGIWSQPAPAAPYAEHSTRDHVRFSQELFAKRQVLLRYFRCLALAGERMRGARALRVTRRAAGARLMELGRERAVAEREAVQFVVTAP